MNECLGIARLYNLSAIALKIDAEGNKFVCFRDRVQ